MNSKEKELLKKYVEGNATEAEIALLESWYLIYQDSEAVEVSEQELKVRYTKIAGALPVKRKVPVKVRMMVWKGVAAACIAAMTIGIYLHNLSGPKEDIAPGGNKAALQIAGHRKINLSGLKNGIIVTPAGVKYKDGSAVAGLDELVRNVQQLTLSVPKGGQYQLVLPDGTRVWLNAASNISYPNRFTGKVRKVKVVGEAYFEVAHDPDKPFLVESREQVLQVLGTGFNLNAYADERAVKTTLIHGKVMITGSRSGQKAIVLKPGQQLSLSGDKSQVLSATDTEEITAWRDGYFKFMDESLEDVMTKLARWYDVEVIYPEKFHGNYRFSGKISRSKNLSVILEIIAESSNIHFKIEGRSVRIMK